MPVKRYKLTLPASSQKIRKARAKLKQISMQRQIELMVAAGVMSEGQAARAKQKLSEAETVKQDRDGLSSSHRVVDRKTTGRA